MHVVILAGGKGRRLQPYTTVFPKPLVPLGEKPILEILIRQLARDGFTRITLAVGYLAELIEAYFGDGCQLGVQIDYAREKTPLGTAGPLKQLEGRLPEHFLCVNGDILTDLSFGDLMRTHLGSGCGATVSLFERSVEIDLGIVHVDGSERLRGWEEKPCLRYLVSMGAYAISRKSLELIDKDSPVDMPNFLLRLKDSPGVATFRHDGFWLDIGRPDDYARANSDEVLSQLLKEIF